MKQRVIPPCREMLLQLTSTGLTFSAIARAVGCHCSTLTRIRDKAHVAPRAKVVEGLFKLYVTRMEEIAPLTDKAKELGL